MKILELRFQNLNSLYGEWIIDFTDPNYVSNGIFALTGPTGAGKSTILDAICLALYGVTPRLKKINQSENEIMSRNTGQCYAEVLFETQAGIFRCHWEQRRARNKASGKLQDVEHQIIDAKTGKPIETKKSLVLGVIEKKTGMDFERFTRSVLLAQGGFDSFLNAGEDEKSKILEQLTGSKIYSDISKSVYERSKEEKEKLNLLKAEIESTDLLNEAQEIELQDKFEESQKREEELKTKYLATNNALNWLNKIAEFKEKINNLEREEIKQQAELLAFKAKREKLAWANRAFSLEVNYSQLSDLRKQQINELASQTELEENLPKLKEIACQQAELLKKAQEITKKAKEDKYNASELIKQVRSLDQSITEQEKNISNQEKNYKAIAKKIQDLKTSLAEEQKKKIENAHKIKDVKKYLTLHKADEWLVSNLAGVEHELKSLDSLKKELEELETEIDKSNLVGTESAKKLDSLIEIKKKQEEEIAKASKDLQAVKESLDNLLAGFLLRELRTKKEALQEKRYFLNKIKLLEEERKSLRKGEACPLCGSLQHPYIDDKVPQSNKIEEEIKVIDEIIKQAEDKENQIKKLEQAEKNLIKKLVEIDRNKVLKENEVKTTENLLKDSKSRLAKSLIKYSELQARILEMLKPLNIAPKLPLDNSELLKTLHNNLNKWISSQEEKSKLEKDLTAIESQIKTIDDFINHHTNELNIKHAELLKLKEDETTFREKRVKLYGNKNPDLEEKLLQEALNQAEDKEKQSRDKNIELQQDLVTRSKQLESLKFKIKQRKIELVKKEKDFLQELNEKEFLEEKQFLLALITHEEKDILSEEAKKLDDAMTELKARLSDNKQGLQEEEKKNITDKSKDDLVREAKDDLVALEKLRDSLAEIRNKITENNKAKAKIKQKQVTIKAQQKENDRWERLNQLIGSFDGKKYRNFAQGLTFELMVLHANDQLAKMTNRYLLIRDKDKPLELNVIDNYQAGEMRTTKNLSGGESFIVSLALALGLSKMASKKVRVDSLFLDEGFGTLDENALETALESLSGLHQDGKLIGVISHVTSLKDRISTQISISPISRGRSSMQGPGCSEIKPKSL